MQESEALNGLIDIWKVCHGRTIMVQPFKFCGNTFKKN